MFFYDLLLFFSNPLLIFFFSHPCSHFFSFAILVLLCMIHILFGSILVRDTHMLGLLGGTLILLIIGCSYLGDILLRGNGSFYAGWQYHCLVQCLIFDKGQRRALKLSLLILAFLILSLICVNIINIYRHRIIFHFFFYLNLRSDLCKFYSLYFST